MRKSARAAATEPTSSTSVTMARAMAAFPFMREGIAVGLGDWPLNQNTFRYYVPPRSVSAWAMELSDP
jgi:hypothetical protein